jgi:predicted lipoprotein with Yx(FWY)xxD motif
MTTDAQTQARRVLGRGPVSMMAIAAVVAVGLTAAACGSSTPAASGTGTTTTTAPSPAGATGSSGQVVANAVSNAKIGGPILVTSSGMTLYKFSADSAGTTACNSGCTSVWPPLTVPAGTAPKGGPGTGGTFATISRSDGTQQVAYDGHPLYTFSGDSSAGATNGQNITSDGGTWTVVTVGSSSSPASTTTTKPSSGGGYSY